MNSTNLSSSSNMGQNLKFALHNAYSGRRAHSVRRAHGVRKTLAPIAVNRLWLPDFILLVLKEHTYML